MAKLLSMSHTNNVRLFIKVNNKTFKKSLLKNLHQGNFYPKHQRMEDLHNDQVFAEAPSLEA